MQLTSHQLVFVCPTCTNSDAIVAAINAHVQDYAVNTPLRMAAFLGQFAEETNSFNKFVESTNYTDPLHLYNTFKIHFKDLNEARTYAGHPIAIANRVYGGRMGNGNEASGDGYRYRGRGFCQLTGKDEYRQASNDLGVDFITSPDQVALPLYSALVGFWYWKSHSLNELADQGAFLTITKRINGGTLGEPQREAFYALAKECLGA